ncbi:MAG: CocE/NonD family hydrolase [Acidimicrobiales bacterium]
MARDVAIPVADGVSLVGDLWRPVTDEPVPVLAGLHPYNNELQTAPITPEGFSLQRGWMEAGDPNFFARRGYAHAVVNVRGTGKSGGRYQAMGPQESQDVAAAVRYLADQPWCSGAVGLFGISYFSWCHLQTAMHRPEGLRAVFAPFGATDFYRDFLYHGGILAYRFLLGWKDKLDGVRYRSWYLDRHGVEGFRQAVAEALADEEIAAVPGLVACLGATDGADALVGDVVLNRFDDDFWAERRIDYTDTTVPAYLGACWGLDGLHLPAAFRSFERWEGPARLTVGPDVYLDRPLYQLQYEALRWFDHFLKGNDTGMLEEPPVQLFVGRTGRWKRTDAWPLPETRFTPFHLHTGGVLSEREPGPGEAATAYEDSPFVRGEVRFATPPMVEETELLGPAVLQLYCSSTDDDALLIASLDAVDREGAERELARTWLRAAQRRTDESVVPFAPHHLHQDREPLVPGQVYRLELGFSALSVRLLPGERLALRITSCDDGPPPDPLRATGVGHVARQSASVVTVHHGPTAPSALVLPVTEGNVLGTFWSGGHLPGKLGPIPTAKIKRVKVAGESGAP